MYERVLDVVANPPKPPKPDRAGLWNVDLPIAAVFLEDMAVVQRLVVMVPARKQFEEVVDKDARHSFVVPSSAVTALYGR